MKKLFFSALAAILLAVPVAKADQGMWLLPFIEQLNIKNMHERGFKLSAKDIYDINESCLKDAIVIFGRGCTGEIISPNGLILTNHHCGYGSIQAHSTVEHDYLKDGFWAASQEQELPTPGLEVTFIKQIVDVTGQITKGLNYQMSERERDSVIKINTEAVVKQYDVPEQNITAMVKPMFGGNQYIMFQNQIFNDVRMVGTPPQSIGKFGGEADNWMWPRHTGDFSMFRVYADKDGKPAAYSKDNVPYKPKRHLEVSLKGYNEGDYAMIMGFPGRTNRYMTTWEIDQTLAQDNPIRIFIRGERQDIMWQDMLSSDKIRIQYSDKYVNSANFWKNSMGMSRGLVKLNVKDDKQKDQDQFMEWVSKDEDRKAKYGSALGMIEQAVADRRPLQRQIQLLSETLLTPVEIYMPAMMTRSILADTSKTMEQKKEQLTTFGNEFYKDYNTATDRKIATRMMEIYLDSIPASDRIAVLKNVERKDLAKYIDKLYKSPFATKESFDAMVASGKFGSLEKDPAFQGANALRDKVMALQSALAPSAEMFARGHRLYLDGLLVMNQGVESLYPDANFTIRMTYGNILPYKPADGVKYDYFTTLSGVMEKENPQDPEFVVPAKLKELYLAKDFGPYAVDGDVPVALISNNDITGGNSGSPVLNSEGQLIGLAFDGNWEAMSGDIAFEENLQRTISMDVRYVLFIIDKFAGAQRLIDEMSIVK